MASRRINWWRARWRHSRRARSEKACRVELKSPLAVTHLCRHGPDGEVAQLHSNGPSGKDMAEFVEEHTNVQRGHELQPSETALPDYQSGLNAPPVEPSYEHTYAENIRAERDGIHHLTGSISGKARTVGLNRRFRAHIFPRKHDEPGDSRSCTYAREDQAGDAGCDGPNPGRAFTLA